MDFPALNGISRQGCGRIRWWPACLPEGTAESWTMSVESTTLAGTVRLQRQFNLDEAKEWLIRLSQEITANTSLRHLDANIEVETFFRDLLNLVFGWSLLSSNWSGPINQDSFDLDDRHRRLAVQVTSSTDAPKIRKTLDSFLRSHRSDFDRLVFVYPVLSKTESRANFSKALAGFDFDPQRDRFDLRDLLRKIQDLSVDQQDAVVSLLRRELRPLGGALRMGVDQNVEAITAILRHISAAVPSSTPEEKPDADRKMARFREHAAYLKRQFTAYVDCYLAVAEARRAVGYDAVRAVRCARWLQDRSQAALEQHGDNASFAFDTLVLLLLEKVHESGRDCDESAMRYFLADELIHCNVFPNPVAEAR